jgi:nitrite reductase (NO-forming)
MLASDPDAQALLARYAVPMPDQNLTDADIRQLISYFRWSDENAPR